MIWEIRCHNLASISHPWWRYSLRTLRAGVRGPVKSRVEQAAIIHSVKICMEMNSKKFFGSGCRLPVLLVAIVLPFFSAALQTSGSTCTTIMPPQQLALPKCPPSTLTLDDAKAAAHRVAPAVRFHPLEPWYLQSPDVYYENAQLFLTDYLPRGNSTFDFIFESRGLAQAWLQRSFITLLNSTVLSEDEKQQLLAGASFDEAGHSTAKVYYTVEDFDEGTWLFNFNLFYSWNGCSNQDFVLSINGTNQVLQYMMCPVGVHEGDFERVSMLVCKESTSIQQLAYSQHGWAEVRDCTQEGQCSFDAEGHPIAYAGLHSHANFFEASPLVVYKLITGGSAGSSVSLDNLGGVWVADRTGDDDTRSFVPTPDNIVHIPDLQTILSENSSEFQWAVYPGNWGAGAKIMPQLNITCLFDNQTRLGDCNETGNGEATSLLATALKVLDVLPILDGYDSGDDYLLAPNTNQTVPLPSITGPLYRRFTYLWLPEAPAPIHNQGLDTVLCPVDVATVQESPVLAQYGTGIDTLVNYLWGISLGAFLFSILMVLIFALPMVMDKTATARTLVTRTLSSIKVVGGKAAGQGAAAAAAAWGSAAGATAGMAHKIPGASKMSLGGKKKAGKLGEGVSEMSLAESSWESSTTAGAAMAAAAVPSAAPSGVELSPMSTLKEGEQLEDSPLPPHPAAATTPKDVLATAGGDTFAKPAAVAGEAVPGLELAPAPEALESPGTTMRHKIWGVLAVGLFIAGITLVSVGANDFWSNSLASWAADRFGQNGIMYTLKVLIGVGLGLIAFCDIVAFLIIFMAQPSHIKIWKYKFRNYLGSRQWVNRNSFNIHIVVTGLVIIVINVAAIMFALGFIVVVTQVAARIACTKLGSINVLGLGVSNVCITVPSIQADQICGWEALQICYDITGMGVINIVLGGALLLWSHLVWLLMLLLNLWQFYEFEVVAG